uniref:Uncharacterized protein n=1 Tax=Arundo donax TaxID=35708 RepID=A0A0A9H1V2_ARUDO
MLSNFLASNKQLPILSHFGGNHAYCG